MCRRSLPILISSLLNQPQDICILILALCDLETLAEFTVCSKKCFRLVHRQINRIGLSIQIDALWTRYRAVPACSRQSRELQRLSKCLKQLVWQFPTQQKIFFIESCLYRQNSSRLLPSTVIAGDRIYNELSADIDLFVELSWGWSAADQSAYVHTLLVPVVNCLDHLLLALRHFRVKYHHLFSSPLLLQRVLPLLCQNWPNQEFAIDIASRYLSQRV
eukprot:TRINITY_DN9678_c0_g1_i3.p1 TRINITY_DN9678_c0_g1~~TRINITY_DN9678_c0_g1_i3.p1  ORF type:complete len:218 (-),score=27.83 TRINITY_DN9678_c0_g1_i3:105-758(-)